MNQQLTIGKNYPKSNEELRGFFEQNAVGMARVDFSDACCLDVNSALCQMIGRTRDEMLSIPWMEMTHPEDIEHDFANFKKMASGYLDSYSIEKRYIHSEGHIVWVKLNLSLMRDQHGNPAYEIVIVNNINDRKLAEQKLSESRIDLETERNRLQVIIETIPTGLIMMDKDGILLIENDEWQKTWAKSSRLNDSIDYDNYIVFRPNTGERLKPDEWPCALAFKNGTRSNDIILDIERFNGERGTIVVSSAPIHNKWGELVGAVAASMDITELRATQKLLEEADQRKDEFLAMLSHELRNPLSPIIAAAQIIGLGKLNDEELKKTSQIITRQVHHLTKLLEDLLDMSRVTRGLVSITRVRIDIKQILAHAVEQLRPMIEQHGHKFVIQLSPESTHVFGDRDRLVQIVSNLLNNATKYTPAKGIISLELEVDNDFINLRVRDNGVGISAEFIPHIFELFSQAERSLDRSQGGMGIGLALVKNLVDLHDGTVNCQSNGLGEGSCFTVSLPRVTETISSSVLHLKTDTSPETKKLKILVVDDNIDAAFITQILLEMFGYDVIVENGAQAALTCISHMLPDVVLLDIGLPDMDGYEVAHRIRKLHLGNNIKIIALTGYGRSEDIKKAYEAGFDHHLVKPLDSKKLTDILDNITYELYEIENSTKH